MRDMVHAIGHKDFHALGTLLETDALDMHAVMMTSRPPLHYFTDVTSEIIAWVREQRQTSTLKAYVTIDAGPNPHIICPKSDCEALARAIATKFPQCEYLIDFIGSGPVVQRAVAVE
jgi:diphosphomevalonate decarboxylase